MLCCKTFPAAKKNMDKNKRSIKTSRRKCFVSQCPSSRMGPLCVLKNILVSKKFMDETGESDGVS